jgi:hypothetical protein
MRTKNQIRKELEDRLKEKGLSQYVSRRDLERKVDEEFHWERILAEAKEYESQGKRVRVEFLASPGDEGCKICWDMNGRSLSIEELKKLQIKPACRCAIVLPEDDDSES